jgi:hypothetical protein
MEVKNNVEVVIFLRFVFFPFEFTD